MTDWSTSSSTTTITRLEAKRGLLLHAEQSPDLGVALGVGALGMDDGHVGVERRHGGQHLAGVGAGDGADARVGRREVGAHVVAQGPEGQPRRARR